MSRAVANTLLLAARPASTIARPRPRELPVTNHTCAIHPPLSSPPKYSGEASLYVLSLRNHQIIFDPIWIWREPSEPPDPRSSTVPPGLSFAKAVGFPHLTRPEVPKSGSALSVGSCGG